MIFVVGVVVVCERFLITSSTLALVNNNTARTILLLLFVRLPFDVTGKLGGRAWLVFRLVVAGTGDSQMESRTHVFHAGRSVGSQQHR